MHHRYERTNIPVEIVRTLVVIAETGSFSKAGRKLGLSQPAISAQVKRLQFLVGGPVFNRTPGGVSLTALGELVLAHARKLLAANDQILLLGGAAVHEPQPLRLGLSTLFVDEFCKVGSAKGWDKYLNVSCGHSSELAKGLSGGYIDVGCLLSPPSDAGELVAEWLEEFVWVRSRDFVLSPGSPIPLVCWPGSAMDQPTMQALERSGRAYRIAFTSTDYHARRAAVFAGLGLMGQPKRLAGKLLVVTRDYYLPPIAPVRAGICVRSDVSRNRVEPLIELLMTLQPGAKRRAA